MSETKRLRGDFNGLFGEILCISHGDSCPDEAGMDVRLQAGMTVTIFEKDCDDLGRRDDLIATGTVEESPAWLACNGSRWVLRVDKNGVLHESDLLRKDRE